MSELFILIILIAALIIAALIATLILNSGKNSTSKEAIYRVFDTNLCKELPTCFGQNPATPFARPIFIDENTQLDPDVLTGETTLDDNEAIIIYGKRPPPSLYFGFTPYLYSREVDGKPVVLYASLTDTVNNFSIPENADQLAVIMTKNKRIMQNLKNEYQKQGYHVVELPVPVNKLQPGDKLSMLTRSTYIQSEDDFKEYIKNTGMKAYKITYKNIDTKQLYCINLNGEYNPQCLSLKPRAALPTEDHLKVDFEEFVNDQIKNLNIVAKYDFNNYLGGIQSGYDCIDKLMNCRADNNDATYKDTDQITIGPGQKIYIFGVNHALFNKGIYASISAYSVDNEYGFANYLAPDYSEFYVITAGYDSNNTLVVDPSYHDIVLAERTYVQLPQNIGPTYDSLISPVAYLVQE